MNKIMCATLAVALVAGSLASAEPNERRGERHDPGGGHHWNGGRHWSGGHDWRGGHREGWGRDYGLGHRWSQGQRMGYNDWRNGRPFDYRIHHFRAPPRGYAWREVNGEYVLAAIATGVIASVIINDAR